MKEPAHAIITDLEQNAHILPKEDILAVYQKAHAGDQEAFTALYNSTGGLIIYLCKRYQGLVGSLSDALDAGVMGFVQSVKSGMFNPNKGSWSTYVGYYIIGHMFGERRTRARHSWLIYRNGLQTTDEDRGGEICMNDLVVKDHRPKRPYPSDEWLLVHNVLDSLPNERHTYVLWRYFLMGSTLKEIGQTLGVTRERVRQIKEDAYKSFATQSKQMGVTEWSKPIK